MEVALEKDIKRVEAVFHAEKKATRKIVLARPKKKTTLVKVEAKVVTAEELKINPMRARAVALKREALRKSGQPPPVAPTVVPKAPAPANTVKPMESKVTSATATKSAIKAEETTPDTPHSLTKRVFLPPSEEQHKDLAGVEPPTEDGADSGSESGSESSYSSYSSGSSSHSSVSSEDEATPAPKVSKKVQNKVPLPQSSVHHGGGILSAEAYTQP